MTDRELHEPSCHNQPPCYHPTLAIQYVGNLRWECTRCNTEMIRIDRDQDPSEGWYYDAKD